MKLTRTTLRLRVDLKKQAQKMAFEEGTSLREVFNLALEKYLKDKANGKTKKIIFHTHDLGEKLDNLTRDDFYETPKV